MTTSQTLFLFIPNVGFIKLCQAVSVAAESCLFELGNRQSSNECMIEHDQHKSHSWSGYIVNVFSSSICRSMSPAQRYSQDNPTIHLDLCEP